MLREMRRAKLKFGRPFSEVGFRFSHEIDDLKGRHETPEPELQGGP